MAAMKFLLVYEPVLGSGTTLAAAELTERVCYGLELDPKYADVIITRWQSLGACPRNGSFSPPAKVSRDKACNRRPVPLHKRASCWHTRNSDPA
jgi:DNA modification methylase